MKASDNRVFAVRYISGNDNAEKYVGSISDYQDGGFADPVLMSEDEAQNLVLSLNKYVREHEPEESVEAFERDEWGFAIEEIDIPVLTEDDEDDEPSSAGLDRKNRSTAYVAGRVIAIIEHYASHKFGALTLSNMFGHPLAVASAFVRYVDKNDKYFAELDGLAHLPRTMSGMEQSGAWMGYYHQKQAYEQTTPRTIAETLKMARDKQQMTLQMLSDKTGINISNLSKIERGESDLKVGTLQTICKALGLRIRIE